MMVLRLFFAAVLAVHTQDVLACKLALTETPPLTITETFTSYMQVLYEGQLLNQEDLNQFAHAIEANQKIPHPL